ncbi:MAG: hypothetical protein ACLFTK_16865 [Anaerolineales bacterium]
MDYPANGSDNYSVELLKDQPIVIATAQHGFDVVRDLPAMMEKAAYATEQIAQTAYIIYDVQNVSTQFSRLATAILSGSRGVPGSESDERVKVLVVGHPSEWEMVKESMRQRNLGEMDIPNFLSTEEALDYIRLQDSTRNNIQNEDKWLR